MYDYIIFFCCMYFYRELSEGVLSVIDGSFEQELWHKGNQESCLLLIMEFPHPDYRTA